jgi:hypothetical protein
MKASGIFAKDVKAGDEIFLDAGVHMIVSKVELKDLKFTGRSIVLSGSGRKGIYEIYFNMPEKEIVELDVAPMALTLLIDRKEV